MTLPSTWLFMCLLSWTAASVRIDVEVALTSNAAGAYPSSVSFTVPRHVSGLRVLPEACIVDLAWERCGEQELTAYLSPHCQVGRALTFSLWFGDRQIREPRIASVREIFRRSVADPVHRADCVTAVSDMDDFGMHVAHFIGDTPVIATGASPRFLALRHLCRIDGTRDSAWALELVNEQGGVPDPGPDQVAFLHFGDRLWLSGSRAEHRATGPDRLVRVPGTPGMSLQVIGPHDTQGMQVSSVSESIVGAFRPLILGARTNAPCFCNATAMCRALPAASGRSVGTRARLADIALNTPGPLGSFMPITRATYQGVILFNGPLAVVVSGVAAFLSIVVLVFGCYLACTRRTILMRPTKGAIRALRDLDL